ncbi:transcriptional antiterminator, BglG family [Streptococcus equinus]|uniref:Transcriptional antiterminator, BglG family n=1 Tax=Streptococcus equinus TaxID=1335 RepID=A0A1H0ZS81_STREI|nr:PRD domain-containing protein [Streptococcus equinus]SDQ30297.1 transcriptional antiterminator, BglG family [Streptococcus equinus]
MKIKKSLNANAVLAVNEDNSEYILFGKGIGYGKKIGDEVDSDAVNQTFIPMKNSEFEEYLGILESIPPELLEVTRKIVDEAQESLNCQLNPSIYFMLSDHLNFAIERFKNNVTITNRVFWEIKNYYPEEFKLGLLALKLIKREFGLILPEEEAANVAFHIINAQTTSGRKGDGMNYAKLIASVNSIIRYSINFEIDSHSIHYQRFITHLKFFAERFFSDSMLEDDSNQLFDQIAVLYPRAIEISFLIKDHLELIYHKKITKDEIAYLAIHINRMLTAQEIAQNNKD